MKRCISMLKPIKSICQHNMIPCLKQQNECINWLEFEYYDPSKTYPYGTLRIGDKTTILTNRGWLKLGDCTPDFKSFGIKTYMIKRVYIKNEECGCFEAFNKKSNNIKRLTRNLEIKKLEEQYAKPGIPQKRKKRG